MAIPRGPSDQRSNETGHASDESANPHCKQFAPANEVKDLCLPGQSRAVWEIRQTEVHAKRMGARDHGAAEVDRIIHDDIAERLGGDLGASISSEQPRSDITACQVLCFRAEDHKFATVGIRIRRELRDLPLHGAIRLHGQFDDGNWLKKSGLIATKSEVCITSHEYGQSDQNGRDGGQGGGDPSAHEVARSANGGALAQSQAN